jgi:hypothetical protein
MKIKDKLLWYVSRVIFALAIHTLEVATRQSLEPIIHMAALNHGNNVWPILEGSAFVFALTPSS